MSILWCGENWGGDDLVWMFLGIELSEMCDCDDEAILIGESIGNIIVWMMITNVFV